MKANVQGELQEKIQQLKELIDGANRIVFFGGAGVSTESGIKDFRSEDGLYREKHKFPPEVMLSHSFFFSNTEDFYEFYRDKLVNPNVKPNITHYFLAELERTGKLAAVVTQNIDGLHQMAGSRVVYELHGSLCRNYCTGCHKFFDGDYVSRSRNVPICDSCGEIIKPDVVLYEEPLDEDTVEGAVREIYEADLLIIGGTSLTVYPAAALIEYFNNGKIVLINRDPTPRDNIADLVINASLGQVFDQIKKLSQ